MSEGFLRNNYNLIDTAYDLMAETVIASTTNQFTFSGLNINKGEELLLSITLKTNANGTPLSIYFNGNITDTNYYRQSLQANTSTITAARSNNSIIMAGTLNTTAYLIGKIKISESGLISMQTHRVENVGTSSVIQGEVFLSSTFTGTSITQITLYSSGVGIDIGTRIQLYKLKAAKIVDVITSAATTTIDITGLTFEKGNEYLLVSDVTGAISSPIDLFINNNNTLTNYYYQNLYADGTAYVGARENRPRLLYSEVGNKNVSYCIIKILNSGYLGYESEINRNMGLVQFQLAKHYGTSTFTATSITQITIKAETTNAIAAGSRFTLYKLK